MRLACMFLWTLEKSRNRSDLIDVFKPYKGFTRMDTGKLFLKVKKYQRYYRSYLKVRKWVCLRERDCRKRFFSHRMVGRRNDSDQHTVDDLVTICLQEQI